MYFDESLFDDFLSNRIAEKKQTSYEARSQELGWFLSSDNNQCCDEDQSIYIIKHKADFFYAQSEYKKALECYKALSQLIPATNTMLCHEVNKSIILCLMKMNESTEAMNVLEKMLEGNQMDASLWLLLFRIFKDMDDAQGAVFAIQCCLEYHEEVADYWINLAWSYGYLSTCFELEDLDIRFLSEYDGVNALPGLHALQEHDSLDVNNKPFTGQGNQLHDAGASKETSIPTNCNTIKNLNKVVLSNKEIGTSTEENCEVMLDLGFNRSTSLNTEGMDITEVKHYVQNHHYCFCTLCSLIIARFLLKKYSFHSSALLCKKRYKDLLKVINMIKEVTCASDITTKATEKLLNEKFAINSLSKSKCGTSNETDKLGVYYFDLKTLIQKPGDPAAQKGSESCGFDPNPWLRKTFLSLKSESVDTIFIVYSSSGLSAHAYNTIKLFIMNTLANSILYAHDSARTVFSSISTLASHCTTEMFANNKMARRIQDFEKHWFPLP